MAFSKLLKRLKARMDQVFPVLLVGCLCQGFAVACSDPGATDEAIEAIEAVSPAEKPVDALENSVAKGSTTSVEEAVEKVELKAPADLPKVDKPVEKAKETVSASDPKVTQEPVKFPEMTISDEALAIRNLFVEANKQFNEKRFVGAIQTLRKLDSMELGEKEEMALDLFLKRIEKALDGGAEKSGEEKKE